VSEGRTKPTSSKSRAAAIRALEKRIGTGLPAAYRRFLIEDVFIDERVGADVRGLSEEVALKCYLTPWAKDYDRDLLQALDVFQDRIPSRFFPIGRGPGGDLFCIELQGRTAGSIWFWDHEREADDGAPATLANLSRVARSIGDLKKRIAQAKQAPQPKKQAPPQARPAGKPVRTRASNARRGESRGSATREGAGRPPL
jgi:hypothetical protein